MFVPGWPPETHFPEYSLKQVRSDDKGWGMQTKRTLNNQSLFLKNSQSSETKHQCIKWHLNSYKATNQQAQTNILQHKLNACGNVWLPKQQNEARHFPP